MLRAWDKRDSKQKLTEAIRRFYRELVLRRAKTRVVSVDRSPLAEPPIFVLGAYRSGTTLLRYVLDSHSRICIPPETHFLTHLADLVNEPDSRVGLAGLGFDRAATIEELRRMVSTFFQSYASSWNKPRWGDKSPRYSHFGPFLAELFPEGQFVLLFRHGLDQAHSFSRDGVLMRPQYEPFHVEGEDLRITGARYWDSVTRSLLEFEATNAERCHRLRYEDLCSEPEAKICAVLDFLGERWEDAVLRYHEQDHDVGHEDGRVVAMQGFRFSGDHYKSWPEQVLESALDVCSDSLRALGYDS